MPFTFCYCVKSQHHFETSEGDLTIQHPALCELYCNHSFDSLLVCIPKYTSVACGNGITMTSRLALNAKLIHHQCIIASFSSSSPPTLVIV